MNLLFGRNKPGFDRVLLIVTLLLICLGVVIISSASIMESGMKFDDDMYQTKKHLFPLPWRFCRIYLCLDSLKNLGKMLTSIFCHGSGTAGTCAFGRQTH